MNSRRVVNRGGLEPPTRCWIQEGYVVGSSSISLRLRSWFNLVFGTVLCPILFPTPFPSDLPSDLQGGSYDIRTL